MTSGANEPSFSPEHHEEGMTVGDTLDDYCGTSYLLEAARTVL